MAQHNGGKIEIGRLPGDPRKLLASYKAQLGKAWTEDASNPAVMVIQSESLQARRVSRYLAGNWQNEQLESDTAAVRVVLQDGTEELRVFERRPGDKWRAVDVLPEAYAAVHAIADRWDEHAGIQEDRLEAKRQERSEKQAELKAELEVARVKRQQERERRKEAAADVQRPEAEARPQAISQ